MIFFYLIFTIYRVTKKNNQEQSRTIKRMSHTCEDASWRWWTGENFEEEWHATSKACGARATVLGKYFPNAYERMSQYQKGRLLDVQLPKKKAPFRVQS